MVSKVGDINYFSNFLLVKELNIFSLDNSYNDIYLGLYEDLKYRSCNNFRRKLTKNKKSNINMADILTGDQFYDKVSKLTHIRTDSINWKTYYLDISNLEKWVEEYPNSELHAGGAPQLKKIEKLPWE